MGRSPSRSAGRSPPTTGKSSANGPSTGTASSSARLGMSAGKSTPASWFRYCPSISSRPMCGPFTLPDCLSPPRSRFASNFLKPGSTRPGWTRA